jgi:hypothetical protein
MSEIREFLERHLWGIFAHDVESYRATTSEDLGLYEWHIIPQRIDGRPFHDFRMTESARAGAVPLAGGVPDEGRAVEPPRVRFDLANYREQVYGDAAIASYTIIIQSSAGAGITVRSYNESRVMIRFADGWRVVHVHKSPTYKSPLDPPA